MALLAGFSAATLSPARAENVTLLPPVIGASQIVSAAARSGVALGGYDPVSYLLEPRPRLGASGNELLWGGLAWRFARAANRAAFERDPESFLPRIGGYDAWAAAAGRVVEADPDIYAVAGGRLYLFRSPEGRTGFLAQDGVAAEAEARWRALRAGLVRG